MRRVRSVSSSSSIIWRQSQSEASMTKLNFNRRCWAFLLALILGLACHGAAEEPRKASEAELRKTVEAQEKLHAEMHRKELELLEKQLELATKQLELLQKANADKDAVAAYAALVEVKRAELQLRQAADKARALLDG